MSKSIDFRPVILAGGSGTRFWPRSRRAHAKQVLALDGERSMIQQTVERLKPLAAAEEDLGHHQQVPGAVRSPSSCRGAAGRLCRSRWRAIRRRPAGWRRF
jgi:hypothetical protein